ncbi:unnamed protein product, partial [marine sediment metagenome]
MRYTIKLTQHLHLNLHLWIREMTRGKKYPELKIRLYLKLW